MESSINGHAIKGSNYGGDKPSPLYRQAVAALRRLSEEESIDSAERAFAEAVHDEWADRWERARAVTLSRGEDDWNRWLLWLGGQYDSATLPHPPGWDHISRWNRDGQPHMYVSQPYHLPWGTLQELVAWCTKHGLRADVNARLSWWFPGSTLLVEITRDDDR